MKRISEKQIEEIKRLLKEKKYPKILEILNKLPDCIIDWK